MSIEDLLFETRRQYIHERIKKIGGVPMETGQQWPKAPASWYKADVDEVAFVEYDRVPPGWSEAMPDDCPLTVLMFTRGCRRWLKYTKFATHPWTYIAPVGMK